MGKRRNNPQDMTIIEDLEDIKDKVCGCICKYFADAEAKASAIHCRDHQMVAEMVSIIQQELSEHCEDCPIKRL